MRWLKIGRNIIAASVSCLTIFQHIVLVLSSNSDNLNSFDWFLNDILHSIYWNGILIALFVSLIIFTVIDVVHSILKQRRYTVQSYWFRRFFRKWYSQPGKLVIICDDIDWTCRGDDDSIFQALKKKCVEGLTLYLGKGFDSSLAKQLQEKGAKVLKARPSLIQEYIFSCLAPMGNYSNIIVRQKSKDSGQTVKISELSDNCLISLLINILEES